MLVLFISRYEPSIGYTWDFDNVHDGLDDENDILRCIHRERKKKMALFSHQTGEHTEYDEEHMRASEAMDRLLVRLNERKTT
jgi:hypothetical protein